MRIHRADEQQIAQSGHTAIHKAAADAHVGGHGALILPQWPAGAGIERGDVTRGLGDVHHAINHQRRSFNFTERGRLIDPLGRQLSDIGRGDLRQPGMPVRAVIAGVSEPVFGLLIGFQDLLVGDLRSQRGECQ